VPGRGGVEWCDVEEGVAAKMEHRSKLVWVVSGGIWPDG
jgi:hypothetical protein